jgi:septal ring factor EnvC (AmiA/AmiB activator)
LKQERLSQVQSELASLSATVNGLAASSAALAPGLAAAQASIDMLASQLGNVASEEDLAEITDALAAVQADVTELLQANSVINQSITISNLAILEFVETLIETQGTWGVSKICNNNVS